MPSFVVVAGADVEMDSGSSISARIDLNLHLAPPTTADFLRLGSGSSASAEQQQQQNQQQQNPQNSPNENPQENNPRRILPRFGPGIHGVYLDLQQENEEGSSASSSRMATLFVQDDINHDINHGHGSGAPTQHPLQNRRSSSTSNRVHQIRSTRRTATNPSSVVLERSRIRIQEAMRNLHRHHHHHHHGTSQEAKDKDPVKENDDEDNRLAAASVKPGGTSENNFDCNVCLDIAIEPVVTVCGHLFCWHCLYEWLYVHSDNEECPVCKGFVCEGSIIPIYGRGSSSSGSSNRQVEQTGAAENAAVAEIQEGNLRGNVPPRPRARRVDSLRQRLEPGHSEARDTRDWDMEIDPEGRRAYFHLDEVLRMRRAVRYLQDSMGSRSRLLRRRMSERRELFRAPTAAPNIPQPAAPNMPQPVPASSEALATPTTTGTSRGGFPSLNDLEMRATFLQDDYARAIAASRAETEDRVAVIRARLANLVETIESHRRMNRRDIPMRSRPLSPDSAAPEEMRSRPSSPESAAPEETREIQETRVVVHHQDAVIDATFGPQEAEMDVEAGQASGGSGDDDIDSELLHSRKRRRLN